MTLRSMKPYFNSLRFKLFFGILLIIVPLITVVVIYNVYSVEVVRNQVAQSNKNLLTLYMAQVDRNLEEVDNYLFDMSESDMDLLKLDRPAEEDQNEYTLAKLRLYNNIVDNIGYYSSFIDLLFIYSAPNEELFLTEDFGEGTDQRNAVRSELREMLKATEPYNNSNWYVWQGQYDNYIFHLVRSGDVYIGAWVNSDKLLVPMNLIDLGDTGAILLTTDKLEPLGYEDLVRANKLDLRFTDDSFAISGSSSRYLVIGEQSSQGLFNLIALIPDKTILQRLPDISRIASIISAFAIAFLLLYLFFMRRVFLQPVKRMIIAMRKLRDGHWETRLERRPESTEFEMMNDTFNHMIEQIHDLKINVYEEKLNLQRSELKHLQLQINPHFFLNSLNIIFNLAAVKDYKLIQEMASCLVAYFRFMFRSNSYTVALGDELKHTANYLRIQQLRFPDNLTYEIDTDAALSQVNIPPLIIQTLVENTIKHAISMEDSIHIHIKAARTRAEDQSYLGIEVSDTGPGFPEEVLRKLTAGHEEVSEEGDNIGFWNMRRRLRLIYAEKASINFFNQPDKGACVRILLPIEDDFIDEEE